MTLPEQCSGPSGTLKDQKPHLLRGSISSAAYSFEKTAPVFAALNDSTRLQLTTRLACEGPQSISALANDEEISRQAITKHLRVLEEAGLAASRCEGRERIFELRPEGLARVHRYLDQISDQWDEALNRLQSHLAGKPDRNRRL